MLHMVYEDPRYPRSSIFHVAHDSERKRKPIELYRDAKFLWPSWLRTSWCNPIDPFVFSSYKLSKVVQGVVVQWSTEMENELDAVFYSLAILFILGKNRFILCAEPFFRIIKVTGINRNYLSFRRRYFQLLR